MKTILLLLIIISTISCEEIKYVPVDCPPQTVKVDTLFFTDTLFIKDTIFIDKIVKITDTVLINTIIKDTLYVDKIIRDTITVQLPPITIRDTIIIKDTELIVNNPWMGEPITEVNQVLREYWTNISGNISSLRSNSRYPNSPTGKDYLQELEAVSWNDVTVNRDYGDQYGQKIRGHITPKISGDYTFWIAADNYGELYLSTDERKENSVIIASTPEYTSYRQWTRYPQQKSKVIPLTAGKSYYFEVLHVEGTGNDNLSIGWTKPNQAIIEIIPNEVLTE